jgi:hypothetical protein
MHRTLVILSSLAVAVCASGATGCSSSSTPPAPAVPDGISGCASSSTVSFKNDIIPIFQLSCTLSEVCHGQMNNAAEENLYLGENAGGTDVNTVYKGIVGVAALENPMESLIATGSIQDSFLWHKVHANDLGMYPDLAMTDLLNQCAPAAMASTSMCGTDCAAPTFCGNSMPSLSAALEDSQLCTIQNWILAGAQNN